MYVLLSSHWQTQGPGQAKNTHICMFPFSIKSQSITLPSVVQKHNLLDCRKVFPNETGMPSKTTLEGQAGP